MTHGLYHPCQASGPRRPREQGRRGMRKGECRWTRPIGFLLLGLAALAAPRAGLAQEDFYRGKLVTIIVGDPPGGAADAYARLLQSTLGKYLPGNPTLIVQTMPGASSIIAA